MQLILTLVIVLCIVGGFLEIFVQDREERRKKDEGSN